MLAAADQNLIITGYTGTTQQTAVAQKLAERLKRRFINVELQIEARAEMALDDFRARFGAARLKTLEQEALGDLMLYRGTVLHISGQTLMRADYAHRLREIGTIICLVVSLDAALRQMHIALGGRYHDPRERALAVGRLKNEWAVRGLSDVIELNVTYLNQEEILAAVQTQWEWSLPR